MAYTYQVYINLAFSFLGATASQAPYARAVFAHKWATLDPSDASSILIERSTPITDNEVAHTLNTLFEDEMGNAARTDMGLGSQWEVAPFDPNEWATGPGDVHESQVPIVLKNEAEVEVWVFPVAIPDAGEIDVTPVVRLRFYRSVKLP